MNLRTLFSGIFLLAYSAILAQNATQPTIMVVPNEGWCIENGFTTSYTDSYTGQTKDVPDYRRAVNNQELIAVIAKMNEMFSERGFPLKNMQSELQKIDRDAAATSAMMSREGGSISKSPLDELNESAKADILLAISWKIYNTGPKRSLTFTIQALDSYTSKQVGGASGTGAPSFDNNTASLLQEAVLQHVDNLQSQMMDHFDDLRANGREITMRVMVWDDADYDLETECGDGEIIDIVADWLDDNAVGGVYNESSVTETRMTLEDVRIPLYTERGSAMNARRFGRNLSKEIRSSCPDADDSGVKVSSRGLGEVWLVLGGK